MIIFFLNNLQIYKVFGIIEESFEEMFVFTLIKKEFGQEETMKQSCEERQARLLLRWKRMSRNKWDKREVDVCHNAKRLSKSNVIQSEAKNLEYIK